MSLVKGYGKAGRRVCGQTVRDRALHRAPTDESTRDWADETPESEQLRRALIEAGRAAMPHHDPARLERVFRRIVAQLEKQERDGIPGPRIDSPSGVTAKIFG